MEIPVIISAISGVILEICFGKNKGYELKDAVLSLCSKGIGLTKARCVVTKHGKVSCSLLINFPQVETY